MISTRCATWPRPCASASHRSQGLADLQVEKQNRIPQLRVEADHERAKLYGVTPAALTGALEGMSNGRTVSQVVTEGNRRFDVVIRLSDTDRSTTGLARPSDRDPVRARAAPSRRARSRRPTAPIRSCARTASAASPSMPTATARATARRSSPISAAPSPRRTWPQGYSATLEGSYQAYEEAARRIGILSLASLALIFLVLQSRYRSAVLALIIMGNVPLALIGSVAALWIAGLPLSVASMMGFVTLAGISTRNGILKISRYINLALHEGEQFGPAPRHARQPRTARAGAAHRPVGGARADAAPPRSRRAGPRNPPSGGRDHLRRTGEFDVARRGPDADSCFSPSAASRSNGSRLPARTHLRPPKSTSNGRRSQHVQAPVGCTALVPRLRFGAAAQGAKKGANGGDVVVMEGHPIEFVSKGQEITFYILDDDGK